MHRSRLRSVIYAMFTGMLLGCGGVIGFALSASPSPASEVMGGAAGLVATMLPGVFFLGVLFTAPSALALVFTMAGLRRSGLDVLAAWQWAIGGFVAAIPVALFFGLMLREGLFHLPSVHMAMLGFGVLSGLAARWGYREVAEDSLSRKPSTTAS